MNTSAVNGHVYCRRCGTKGVLAQRRGIYGVECPTCRRWSEVFRREFWTRNEPEGEAADDAPPPAEEEAMQTHEEGQMSEKGPCKNGCGSKEAKDGLCYKCFRAQNGRPPWNKPGKDKNEKEPAASPAEMPSTTRAPSRDAREAFSRPVGLGAIPGLAIEKSIQTYIVKTESGDEAKIIISHHRDEWKFASCIITEMDGFHFNLDISPGAASFLQQVLSGIDLILRTVNTQEAAA